ncbi:MAG: hypothetical protein ACP5NX_03360, partial [Candidatus Bilamarchaeaceae archaeon]
LLGKKKDLFRPMSSSLSWSCSINAPILSVVILIRRRGNLKIPIYLIQFRSLWLVGTIEEADEVSECTT